MGRTHGAKDGKPRSRSTKTEAQRKIDGELQAKKLAAARAQNLATFRSSLFRQTAPPPPQQPPSDPPSLVPLADPLADPPADPLAGAVELRGIPQWTVQQAPEEIAAHLDALDDENEQQGDDDDDEPTTDSTINSVMNIYLQAIQNRLKFEVKESTADKDKWLIKHLKESDWWILQNKASWLCKNLGVAFDEVAYYRNIFIWLPELRWGHVAWPPCPSCFQQNVAAHGFRHDHFARRVVTMNSNYFIMSRRYVCKTCTQTVSNSRLANKDKEELPAATFMGYNSASRTLLPHGLGMFFPAFFTYRGAVDNSVIDLMRPLFDKGVRPESFSSTMLELHSKKYVDDYLMREFGIQRQSNFVAPKPQFSTFADKMRYSGVVPTGKYLMHVYKLYSATIMPHFEKEIKKQPSTRFHIDASYKEAKHLAQYHGHPLFKSLITVTNEYGAIRLQFHTVTDGHDQMIPAVAAFVNTANEYGQALPELAATDNPKRDQKWLYEMIPSLQETQEKLDNLVRAATLPATTTTPTNKSEATPSVNNDTSNSCESLSQELLPTANIGNPARIRVASSMGDISRTVLAVRDIVKARSVQGNPVAVALDAEWDTKTNRTGQVIDSFKTAVIQLGFRDTENRVSALLLQVFRHQRLPQSLLALLGDKDIVFVGASVSSDLIRIGKDFQCSEVTKDANYVNLGMFARKRDVVQHGTASLEKLVQLTLGEFLDKAPDVRLSKWSNIELTDAQKKYAALDAMKSLEVYEHLESLPDLTIRLSPEMAMPNLVVDVVPSHGNVASMATRAAIGQLLDGKLGCHSPVGITPAFVKPNQHTCVVTITSIMSPSLVIPGYKKTANGNNKACFGDFGRAPFKIVLPLKMLKPHVDSPTIRTLADIHPASTRTAPVTLTNSIPQCCTRPVPVLHDVLHFSVTDERNATSQSNDHDDGSDDIEDDDANEDNSAGSDSILEQEDHIICLLSPDNIDLINLAGVVGNMGVEGRSAIPTCKRLGPAPTTIIDRFSACLGDNFHAMSRPKVPVKHEYKKPYYVALQNAFFAWRPDLLDRVKQMLKHNGFSNEDIDALMYYDVDFFRQRVDRRVLPPRQLYWRVRAVFAIFGDKEDSKLKRPLFNARAWKKAKNILKEILDGFYSDPPGYSFYTNRLDRKGEPMVDKFGIELLSCNRGTNDVEAIHKQLVALYGTWCTGVEMSDALLSERRHRYNHKINENKRLGFPKLGHYDTWKIDMLQLLVENNHNVLLFPDWSNASDYKPTPENFGTVALHTHELHLAVENIQLADDVVGKFTNEMKYLCKTMGVKVPFLPIHGGIEASLFTRLVLEMPDFDESKISIEWCKFVNGHSVFPKLPVYLRLYFERWERNQRIKDAVRKSKNELLLLEQVNDTNMLTPNSSSGVTLPLTPTNDGNLGEGSADGHHHHDDTESINDGHARVDKVQTEPAFQAWASVGNPTPVAQPQYLAIQPHQQLGPPVVAGLVIGLSEKTPANAPESRKRGRGKDAIKRKKRSCARCVQFNGANALNCRGRNGRTGGVTACEYFSSSGDCLPDTSVMIQH